MKLRQTVLCSVCSFALVGSGVAIGQIDPAKRPNLAAAQRLIGEAIQKIDAAQSANKDKLGGHAERAKELLHQADQELNAAAAISEHEH